MTLEDYAALVADMRHAQTDFFRHQQSQERLKRARAMEARVDKATEEILMGQRLLFPDLDHRPKPPTPSPAA